jgi:ornithine lipid ester-linked acyl 2-hydroxylase
MDSAKTFYDPQTFSWSKNFLEATPLILDELEKIINEPATYLPGESWLAAHPSYVKPDPSKGIQWKTYEFVFFGIKRNDHIRKCPNTWNALSQIPELVTAQFSMLEPHTHVLPHKGFSRMVLRSHLPLIVPNEGEMGLRVGEDVRRWKMNELLVFDDSLDHEAWNKSPHRRAVLMFDFAKPGQPYTAEQICRYKIEKMDDPFLLEIAPTETWINWLNRGSFPDAL